MKKTRQPKKTKKSWSRKYEQDPWNDPRVKLELYISPSLQLKLGLPAHMVEKPQESEEK